MKILEIYVLPKLRARQEFQRNRFVIIAAGALVVALLLFVVVSMPHQKTSQTPKTELLAVKPNLSGASPRPRDEASCRSPTQAGL